LIAGVESEFFYYPVLPEGRELLGYPYEKLGAVGIPDISRPFVIGNTGGFRWIEPMIEPISSYLGTAQRSSLVRTSEIANLQMGQGGILINHTVNFF
jgi:hypothetical protein